MIEFMLSLPTWLGFAAAMVTTSVMGFGVYVVSYKLISKYQKHDLTDPTRSLFRVVGLLVSLMLALAFSDVIAELRTIRKAIQLEAVAISDTFGVLKMFDINKTRKIRTLLIEYTRAIIDDDWPALANDRLGQRTTASKNSSLRR